MFKVTSNDLYSANLIAYLENKFNIMLDCENKKGGWMKLHKIQIKNGIFADSLSLVDHALDVLSSIAFIDIDSSGSAEMPLGEMEIWVRLNAQIINHWIDSHVKSPANTHSPIVDYMPYFAFLWTPEVESISVPQQGELVQVTIDSKDTTEPFILEPPAEKKLRKTQDSEPDNTYVGTARNLFAFWKYKTGHKRSNLQNKFANMIISRIKEGYTEGEIACGIIGLTFSDYHIKNKYDHIEYVVRDTKKLDRMIDIAKEHNIDLGKGSEQYHSYLQSIQSGELVEAEQRVLMNKSTGAELK